MPPRDPLLLGDRSTTSEVEAWLLEQRLTPVLDWSLDRLCATRRSEWSMRILGHFNVRQFFSQPTRRQVWQEAHAFVVESLRDLQEDAARAVEVEQSREPSWIRPPPEPCLHDLWRAVHAERDRLKQNAVAAHDPRRLELELRHAPMRIEVRGAYGHAAGSFELEPEPISRLYTRDTMLDLTILAALLDVLAGFRDPVLRLDLVEELSVPMWRRVLRRLETAARPPPRPADDKPLLGWEVDLQPLALRPLRCRLTKAGDGYVTRKVKLEEVPLALFSEEVDREVHARLSDGRGRVLVLTCLDRLIGHPRVFLRGDRKPTPVRRGRLTLALRKRGAGLVLVPEIDGLAADPPELVERFDNRDMVAGGLMVDHAGPALRITPVDPATVDLLRRTFRLLGTPMPAEALSDLLRLLPALHEQVPVEADDEIQGRRVAADERPLVRLRWDNEALAVSVRVRPLPEVSPEVPGQGPPVLFAKRRDEMVHVRRHLDSEPEQVLARLAPLGLHAETWVHPFAWVITSTQEALGVVDKLQQHAETLRVAWTGPRVRISGQALPSGLHLRVKRSRDWFGMEGGLTVGEDEVGLAALLAAALEGHDYLQVTESAWVSISATLRGCLAATAAVDGEARRGKPRLNSLHAPIIDALEEAGARVEAPVDWREQAQRARDSLHLQVDVPDGLRGTLRSYQLEGFRWLAALATWAPGACLADDMGLGKTIQAIALLLHRAPRGPSLVVAPTSVCFNWRAELARFGPSLHVVDYAGSGREARLERLGPGDVLVGSYGVLLRDAEALARCRFTVAVLDEAQAIKNPTTARARSAFNLDADFRLALSGTPVENHTGELYSLMRFVAPGLLGSSATFRERFVVPIEGRDDRDRRALLARLVGPFVLRRTKAVVEPELPSRTEHVYRIEPSPEERSLYVRQRLEAVARMSSSDKDNRFQVMQELQRLRQLACHPRMLDPGSPVRSSKLAAVRRLLADLRDSGHRALVFSSFVKHLHIVREALLEDGFALRYLDGSTSIAARQREVEAFQDGHGDAFLISLKAGGTGLNLTAATYVLHLDPWWNPAAEDQATDRAHRIGQEHPVHVYRLVMAGTIEEQIVALHKSKRELAEALMSGSGQATRVTTEDLAALLSEASAADTGGRTSRRAP